MNKFLGNEFQRNAAVKRVLQRLNERAYYLILNNCEHFANWVQKRLPQSEQVVDVGKTLVITGAGIGLIGLASKDSKVAIFGLVIAAVTLITIGISDQNELRRTVIMKDGCLSICKD